MPTDLIKKKKEKEIEQRKDEEKKRIKEQAIAEVPAMEKKIVEFLRKKRLFSNNLGKAFLRSEIYRKMGFEKFWGTGLCSLQSEALDLALDYFEKNPNNPEGVKFDSDYGFYCEES